MNQFLARRNCAGDLARRASSPRSRILVAWAVIVMVSAHVLGPGRSVEAGEPGALPSSPEEPIRLASAIPTGELAEAAVGYQYTPTVVWEWRWDPATGRWVLTPTYVGSSGYRPQLPAAPARPVAMWVLDPTTRQWVLRDVSPDGSTPQAPGAPALPAPRAVPTASANIAPTAPSKAMPAAVASTGTLRAPSKPLPVASPPVPSKSMPAAAPTSQTAP